MLSNLTKYDFKWINKVMYIYFAIMIIITIVVKIVESFEQTFLLVIVDKIASSMFIACAISIGITCLMRIWGRFIQNVYRDESYLTHTLPVTRNELFNSKIIASVLSLCLSVFIVLVCVAFVYLNESTIESIKMMYNSLVGTYGDTFAIMFIVGIVLLIFLEVICIMMVGIFGVVSGHRFNNSKILKSIFIGLISYGILSTVSFIVLYVIDLNFVNIDNVINGFPPVDSVKILGLTFIITYLIYDLLLFFLTKNLLNKGVNVD